MKHFVLSVDPGNHCGITYGYSDDEPKIMLLNLTPKTATKKRKAEEKHLRYGTLYAEIMKLIMRYYVLPPQRGQLPPSDVLLLHEQTGQLPFTVDYTLTIICEGAAGFVKGKSAIETSNKYRGVVECIAAIMDARYIPIQPNDLQRFATGKGRAEKSEMLQVASARYGYKGTDDNEADSLIMWHFAKEQILR